jgi:hypothetical protein
MPWTNGKGVVISDEKGWTQFANQYVIKLKKWGGGVKHSGGAGRTSRGYHAIMRALADIGVAARKAQRQKKERN